MDLDRMERALRNADAAGDTEAARTIAAAIQQARQQPKAGAAERFGAGLPTRSTAAPNCSRRCCPMAWSAQATG
jgi:hypothetical protein